VRVLSPSQKDERVEPQVAFAAPVRSEQKQEKDCFGNGPQARTPYVGATTLRTAQAEVHGYRHSTSPDLHDENIQSARRAIYSEDATRCISAQRLRRFFVTVKGGYQIAPPLRGMCVFACHDLILDPPFSRMDLISCRNVLKHLTPALQKKVLDLFRYALKPTGFLVTGQSESIDHEGLLHTLREGDVSFYSKTKAEADLRASQRQLRSLSASLLMSTEEERKKIARELHDYFGPALGSINLRVSAVAGKLSSWPSIWEIPFRPDVHGLPVWALLRISCGAIACRIIALTSFWVSNFPLIK